MGWFERIFGFEAPDDAEVDPTPAAIASDDLDEITEEEDEIVDDTDDEDDDQAEDRGESDEEDEDEDTVRTGTVPLERMGVNGKYDQSGLAKRVALAFDQADELDDMDTLFVAQAGSVVVLKGTVADQQTLDVLVEIAGSVRGATDVAYDDVEIAD